MRKLISFLMISLDGYYETPDHSLAWGNLADDFHQYSVSQLNDIGTLLFGRATYQGMVDYWTTEAAARDLPQVAERMNALPKVVFSKSSDVAAWNNTTLVSDDASQAVESFKQQGGRDIAIFGSSALTTSLVEAGLVDELRLMLNPILLGEGRTLFTGLSKRVDLQLLRTTTFASGNLLACYQPVRAG